MNRQRLIFTFLAAAALSGALAAVPSPTPGTVSTAPSPTAASAAPSPAAATPVPVPTPTDAQVKARSSALEVAGAFSNDGFKIRDGHAFLSIAPKAPKFIQANLSSGNQYWFIAAGAGPVKRLAVSLYDETGKPVPTETYENNAQAAAGFSPQASGPYIVRVDELEGEPAVFCLLYSYK